MKQRIYLYLCLFISAFTMAACSEDKGSDSPLYSSDSIEYDSSRKILVAYFSWSGNTQFLAENIAEQTGADLFRIETGLPIRQIIINVHKWHVRNLTTTYIRNLTPRWKTSTNTTSYLSAVPFGGTRLRWPSVHFSKIPVMICPARLLSRSAHTHPHIGKRLWQGLSN